MHIIKLSHPDEVDALMQRLEEQGYIWKNIKKKPTEMSADVKLWMESNDNYYIHTYEEPDFKEKRWIKYISWGTIFNVQEYLNLEL